MTLPLMLKTASLPALILSVSACAHMSSAIETHHLETVGAPHCEITAPFETSAFDSDFSSRIDDLIAHMIERGIAPGAVIRINQNGETVFDQAYGYADRESEKPMETDSLFRIYSMTKPITTIAALQLVEKGMIELDAPISRYLPEFESIQIAGDESSQSERDPNRPPTIRDLMRHTSGLTYRTGAKTDAVAAKYVELGIPAGPGVSDPPTNGMDPVVGHDMFVDRIVQAPLKHDPGTQFTYGNSTDVLGSIVAAVSGQSLSAYMHENIFAAAGMDDSMFWVPNSRRDDFTSAYIVPPQAPSGSPIDYTVPIEDLTSQTPYRLDSYADGIYTRPPDYEFGGAGLVSDADDYLAFTQALMEGEGRLISERLWREARRDQLPEEAKNNAAFLSNRGFGLGFAVRQSETFDGPVFPQCGLFWAGAASTYFWIDEETDTSGVLMTQVFESDVRSYFHELLEAVYSVEK